MFAQEEHTATSVVELFVQLLIIAIFRNNTAINQDIKVIRIKHVLHFTSKD